MGSWRSELFELLTLAVLGTGPRSGVADALHKPAWDCSGCWDFYSASLRDSHSKKLVRLEQKNAKVARQHTYPNEPLFQSPLEGKSSLRSTEAARADDLNVSRKTGGRHVNSCQAAVSLSTLNLNKKR